MYILTKQSHAIIDININKCTIPRREQKTTNDN
ncbi:hypothetical protein AKUH3B110M_UNKNOWN200030 (plasmid) [Apilactobacillus kunkeei]|nr:hypothetical protein AKUH3B110M_UNKNOWN200030 [Apilactobacillus kunkeei]CAI2700358.1 hypothetical protein AKUH3B107A_UNKNOWN200030 [Apilactobacillus kunkeei]CAI2700372.1 hypothetical protein AKUH3B102X_UNKNOWN200030 [Apilactobacillus kunkeei]